MARRAYIDVSHFRSPYDSPALTLTGLGQTLQALSARWPRGRGYVDVSHFRAPYDQGYFQDNQLFGLGADAPAPVAPPPAALAHEGVLDLAWGTASLLFVGAVLGLGIGLGRQLAKRMIPAE